MISRTSIRRFAALAAGVVVLAAVIVAAGALGRQDPGAGGPAPTPTVIDNPVRSTARIPGASLVDTIDALRSRVETTPGDYVSWATLGLAYVQQARVTVDPTYYALADGALERSLEEGDDDNFLAHAGLSSLAAARHRFSDALEEAEIGLEINSFSSILYGALSDAQIQLGRYDEGFTSVQKMVDLVPDTSSLARASYVAELQGDIERATELMTRARDDAPNASDRAFTSFYLGELAFHSGDPGAALTHYNRAVTDAPGEPALLAGKAKAEAATGQVLTAADHYAEVVQRAPDPVYLTEYGRLLESLDRPDEAEQQYDVVDVTLQLFEAQGVEPDAGPILFEADHGDPQVAVAQAEIGAAERPFIAMQDAYAWALHRAGRDDEALEASDRALVLGTRYARFHFHAGMIRLALGDEPGALAELRTAMEINPYFDPLEQVIAADTIERLVRSSDASSDASDGSP